MNTYEESIVLRIETALMGAPHPEKVADAIGLVLATHAVALEPKIVEGTVSGRIDVTVSGAPLRVMIFRETPEMRALDEQRNPKAPAPVTEAVTPGGLAPVSAA